MTVHLLWPYAEASPKDAYRFSDANGRLTIWPTNQGKFLGIAGAWNFLLRIGHRANLHRRIRSNTIDQQDVILLCLEERINDGSIVQEVRDAILSGRTVIGSGNPDAWNQLLPEVFQGTASFPDNAYAGVGYRFPGTAPKLIAPCQWSYFVFDRKPCDGLRQFGEVVNIQGERQTPSRALIRDVPFAPAMFKWRNLLFLNASPFNALQAWLQGQEDIGPWLNWRNRLFWLDEYVSDIRALVEQQIGQIATPGIPGLAKTNVVLRHDLDHSRDTSYLDEERRRKLPATHAVLRDRNAKYWCQSIAQDPGHEVAFHYNTGSYSRYFNWIRRRLGRPPATYKPARSLVTGKGLRRQVAWARRNGIGTSTLHRHLSFLIYPEWVDAMDDLTQRYPDLLGSSSLFRGQVLRWGVDRVDGGRGTLTDFPDAQFPYWFPLRLGHAGHGGRMLSGWETSSLMEVEPELVEQLLSKRTPGIPHNVFILNFHPAHANQSTLCKGGSLTSFTKILTLLQDSNCNVSTLKSLYTLLNTFIERNERHA